MKNKDDSEKKSFCTSVHCMDGRIQEPVIKYLKDNYDIKYVDTITEPGPCRILAENTDKTTVDAIIKRVDVSTNVHGSKLMAVSGHYDCAGNPCDEETQRQQIKKSIEYLKNRCPGIQIIGLWIDQERKIQCVGPH